MTSFALLSRWISFHAALSTQPPPTTNPTHQFGSRNPKLYTEPAATDLNMYRSTQTLASTTRRLAGGTQRTWLHSTASRATKSSTAGGKSDHTPDSYSKDVDTSSAPDSSVHRVDPSNSDVQKPHEPPSGEWSRAGVQSEEYRHMEGGKSAKGAQEPYSPAGGEHGAYGGRKGWKEEKGPETSKSDQGPEGKNAGGRK